MTIKYPFVIFMIMQVGVQFRAAAQIDKDQAIGIVKSSLTNEELQIANDTYAMSENVGVRPLTE